MFWPLVMYAAVEKWFFFLLMTKGTFAKAMEQDKLDYVPICQSFQKYQIFG